MSYYLFDDISLVAVPDAYTSPADTTICEGSSLNLTASPAGAAYTSSTGAITQSIEVTEPGTYLVQIELEDGCIVEASANVYSRFCGDQCPALFIPNAFSPNGDGVNDWFHPHNTRYLTEVEWQIFFAGEASFLGVHRPAVNGTAHLAGRPVKPAVIFLT